MSLPPEQPGQEPERWFDCFRASETGSFCGKADAVVESFFNLLKRERIRRGAYRSREEARQDVFDYIEMFYNPIRKHVRNEMLSPV